MLYLSGGAVISVFGNHDLRPAVVERLATANADRIGVAPIDAGGDLAPVGLAHYSAKR
jgi:hypothetical protein